MPTYSEIHNMVLELNVSEKEDLTFKSAVVIMVGLCNDTTSKNKIRKITGYWWREIEFIIHNLRANGIIKEGAWCMDVEDEETNWLELILCAMAGSGELARVNEGEPITEEKRIKWEDLYNTPFPSTDLSLLPIEEEPMQILEPELPSITEEKAPPVKWNKEEYYDNVLKVCAEQINDNIIFYDEFIMPIYQELTQEKEEEKEEKPKVIPEKPDKYNNWLEKLEEHSIVKEPKIYDLPDIPVSKPYTFHKPLDIL